MTANRLKVIILDFDGVVVESNEIKTEAFRRIFSRFPEHAEAMMDFHHAHAWASRFMKIDHLLSERLGRADDDELRQQLATEFSETVAEQLITVPFVAGAESFLSEFSEAVPLYVASVTPQADLDSTIASRGLGRYFRGVYGYPPWTKAQAIRDVLEREKCEPGAAALIGDAPGDLQAAAECGVEFIARRSQISFSAPPPVMYPDLHAIADAIRPRVRS
ncbi:MAG TPA: HAD hydrolase-like protein [Gemmatimonadaceae bacterium]|nr:HAD hydrolase-like protein [Gemmatimonadaceae bacterium]